ncbi:hypothetical protein [Lentzea terrae]|uniref:hypothetical protein n=1 Tax=Lentzea terrae TaxID=2200761 RepID=UPI0013006EA4|nr:hypothetical protein [Lentzea terrae]
MKRTPLVAALVAVLVLIAVVWVRQSNEPAGDPTTRETFQRVSVRPLETTIQLTR